MAKKKKGKNKNPQVRPPAPQNDPGVDVLGPDAGGAKQIAESLIPTGSTGRVNTGFQTDANGQVIKDANGNPMRVGETAEALDRLKATASTAGARTAEQQAAIANLQAGLGGYNSQQLQGQREQAQRGIDTQYKTGLSSLARAQARSGVRGASAVAQQANAERDRVAQQQNLEQDIFVKNADEMQRRAEGYQGTLQGLEGEEINRGRMANSDYINQLNNQRADELSRERENLDRGAAEQGGKIDTYFKTIDMAQNRRTGNRNYNLARQMARKAGA